MAGFALAVLPACALVVVALAQMSEARAASTCPARVGFTSADAEPEAADALAAGLDLLGAGEAGATWIGKLASVGHGRRDTIIHVPAALDRTRPIDLVVFMDGVDSFSERTMESRHAAAIAAIAGASANAVYVAPDAPSSRFGDRDAGGAYWKAGCAARACAGGHAAPGDFAQLYRDVIAHVDHVTCAPADTTDATQWRLALVGFSTGGRGVRDAIVQLAAPGSDVALADVGLARVVYADAISGAAWLSDAWAVIAELAAPPEVMLLLQAGGFDRGDQKPGHANRARAWAFARAKLGARSPPAGDSDADVVLGGVRLRRLALDHHGIGDAAVDAAL
jgi:hypothetical protein